MPLDALNLFKRTPLSYLGMTFTISWVFVVFYTPALSSLGPLDLDTTNLFRICNLVASLGAFLLLIALQKRFGEISLKPVVQIVSACITSVCTLLVALIPLNGTASWAFAIGACVLASICSTPLYIAWGHFYGQSFNRASKTLLPLASALAMLLSLVCLFLNGLGLTLIAAALPLLSLLFYRKAVADSASETEEAKKVELSEEEAYGRFPWRIAVVLAIFWFIFTYMNAYTTSAQTYSHEWLYGWGFALGLAGSVFVIFQFSNPKRHTTFSTVFRTAIPLLLLGVILLLLLPNESVLVVHSICLAAMTIINVHILIFGAVFVRKNLLSATTSFAGMRVFASAGEGLAIVAFYLLSNRLDNLTLAISLMVMTAVLVCALLLSMTDTNIDNFHDNRHIRFHSEVWQHPPPSLQKEEELEEESLTESRIRAMEAFEQTCFEIAKTYELSARETEVLILVGRGRDLPYICERLYISKPTTNTHIRHIYEKIGIHSKQELIDLLEMLDEEREATPFALSPSRRIRKRKQNSNKD